MVLICLIARHSDFCIQSQIFLIVLSHYLSGNNNNHKRSQTFTYVSIKRGLRLFTYNHAETLEPYAQYSDVTATASDLLKSSKHIHPLMNLFQVFSEKQRRTDSFQLPSTRLRSAIDMDLVVSLVSTYCLCTIIKLIDLLIYFYVVAMVMVVMMTVVC